MCEFLLQRGASVKNHDKKKLTPFIQAKRAGREKICDLLIEFGAEDDQKKPAAPKKQTSSVNMIEPAQKIERKLAS